MLQDLSLVVLDIQFAEVRTDVAIFIVVFSLVVTISVIPVS